VLRLKALKLVHQRVKVSVRNLRIVQHVIAIFVVPNLFAQSFDLFLDFLIGGGTGHDWEIIVGAAVYPVAIPSTQEKTRH
jgi:hypothetical protein